TSDTPLLRRLGLCRTRQSSATTVENGARKWCLTPFSAFRGRRASCSRRLDLGYDRTTQEQAKTRSPQEVPCALPVSLAATPSDPALPLRPPRCSPARCRRSRRTLRHCR